MSKPIEDENVRVKDYFGTFLESVKRASPEYPDQAAPGGAPADSGSNASSGVGGIDVLTILAPLGRPMALADLMAQLNIGAMHVEGVLTPLVESGLIEVTGDPGSEMVSLTQDGARFTSAAS